MATYSSTKILRSAQLTNSVAFPVANATVATAGFDLNVSNTGRNVVTLALHLAWPALATHNNASQTITVTLEESGDNSNWSNLNPLIQAQIVGVATNGAAANNLRLPFPSHISNFCRANIAVPSSGPNVTNKNLTASVVML